MKKKIYDAAVMVSAILLIWIGLSFIDVVANNLDEGPANTSWNFFQLLVRDGE